MSSVCWILLVVVCCVLWFVCCALCVACCVLCVRYCLRLLCDGGGLWFVVCCLLSAVVLFVVWCSLPDVVCRLLFVVRYVPCVVCCL